MRDNQMKILVVEPWNEPKEATIDGSLQSMQNIVGGWIEMVYPFEDQVAIVCNEEGKLDGLQPNRLLRDKNGMAYDCIHGTFFIVGLGEEDCCSLTDEQISTYTKMFSLNPTRDRSNNRELSER